MENFGLGLRVRNFKSCTYLGERCSLIKFDILRQNNTSCHCLFFFSKQRLLDEEHSLLNVDFLRLRNRQKNVAIPRMPRVENIELGLCVGNFKSFTFYGLRGAAF